MIAYSDSTKYAHLQVIGFTALAMFAFAANSLLCRLALRDATVDPISFTLLRIAAGALVLWLLIKMRRTSAVNRHISGDWPSAIALMVYALGFSLAYVQMSASAGALLLFGAVQFTMMAVGLFNGERFNRWQTLGAVIAVVSFLLFLLPSASAPPLTAAIAMIIAGIGWGGYSLLGRGSTDPLAATAHNFIRALPLAAIAWLLVGAYTYTTNTAGFLMTAEGGFYAVLSGAIASGLGYALWYHVLPKLSAMQAASVQLSVPIITAIAAALLLAEHLSIELLVLGSTTLGGIALILKTKPRKR